MLFAKSNLLNYNYSWMYCQENTILEVEGISCSNSSLAKMLMALCISLPLFHLISWVGLISSGSSIQQIIWSLGSYVYNSQGVNITPRKGLWLPGAHEMGARESSPNSWRCYFRGREIENGFGEWAVGPGWVSQGRSVGSSFIGGRPINAAKSKYRQGLKTLMVLRTDLQKYPIRHVLVTNVTKAKENYAKPWFLAFLDSHDVPSSWGSSPALRHLPGHTGLRSTAFWKGTSSLTMVS